MFSAVRERCRRGPAFSSWVRPFGWWPVMARRVHRREMVVTEAEFAVHRVLYDAELTFGEQVRVLSSLLSSAAKYAIRAERHPDDPDYPGGLA